MSDDKPSTRPLGHIDPKTPERASEGPSRRNKGMDWDGVYRAGIAGLEMTGSVEFAKTCQKLEMWLQEEYMSRKGQSDDTLEGRGAGGDRSGEGKYNGQG